MSASTNVSDQAPRLLGSRQVLDITDLAFGGEGLGRVDDFVVFVPFVIPGERVEVELVEVKKQFARARLVRILAPSPDRVEARCRHFGECGGCQYQHLAYEAQLRWKRKQVGDLLEKIGGFSRELVRPVVPCAQPYGYRNRLMVRSQWNKAEQRLVVGFLPAAGRHVVDIQECAIAEPVLNDRIREVRLHPPPRGGLKVVVRALPEGWEVPADSFFQNNRFLLPELVQTVRNALRAGGARHLLDVYCGVGFFGIELSADVDSFVGIEYDRMAIRAARRNAAARGVTNGEFIAGDADERLAEVLGRVPPDRTAVILDPPRVGCRSSSLAHLRAQRPAQVLYVSCHPATLARDLNALCAEGVYGLAGVVPLDMFPHTQHVECVAELRARRPDDASDASADIVKQGWTPGEMPPQPCQPHSHRVN